LLASDGDFAITLRNEIVARAELNLKSVSAQETPGGFHA
jgi:hypothetical protein